MNKMTINDLTIKTDDAPKRGVISNAPVKKEENFNSIRTSSYGPFEESKPKMLDDIQELERKFVVNEIERSVSRKTERNSSAIFASQKSWMNDIIQYPYFGEEFENLYSIAKNQYDISKNIPFENQLASVIGPYVAVKLMTGCDVGFWKHNSFVSNRSKRSDYGQDIIGCSLDFKTTLIKSDHMHRGYSIMDYVLSVPQFILSKKDRSNTVFVQLLVSFLREHKTALVYVIGWATADMFPDAGEQFPNGTANIYSDKHILYNFQLKPFPPYQFDMNKSQIETYASESNDSRWNDFNFRPFKESDFSSTLTADLF